MLTHMFLRRKDARLLRAPGHRACAPCREASAQRAQWGGVGCLLGRLPRTEEASAPGVKRERTGVSGGGGGLVRRWGDSQCGGMVKDA